MAKGKKQIIVTFETTDDMDDVRFVNWLRNECDIAQDGEGDITAVRVLYPYSTMVFEVK